MGAGCGGKVTLPDRLVGFRLEGLSASELGIYSLGWDWVTARTGTELADEGVRNSTSADSLSFAFPVWCGLGGSVKVGGVCVCCGLGGWIGCPCGVAFLLWLGDWTVWLALTIMR